MYFCANKREVFKQFNSWISFKKSNSILVTFFIQIFCMFSGFMKQTAMKYNVPSFLNICCDIFVAGTSWTMWQLGFFHLNPTSPSLASLSICRPSCSTAWSSSITGSAVSCSVSGTGYVVLSVIWHNWKVHSFKAEDEILTFLLQPLIGLVQVISWLNRTGNRNSDDQVLQSFNYIGQVGSNWLTLTGWLMKHPTDFRYVTQLAICWIYKSKS